MINDPFNSTVRLGTEGSEVSLMETACVPVFAFTEHSTCGAHTWLKLQETLAPPSISLTVLTGASLESRGQAGGWIYFNLHNFLRLLFDMEKWVSSRGVPKLRETLKFKMGFLQCSVLLDPTVKRWAILTAVMTNDISRSFYLRLVKKGRTWPQCWLQLWPP